MGFLEAVDVFSGYGETEILRGVSIRVERGEFVTIIGPNGAGKSTLVKTVIGLLKPRAGSIRFDGADITGLNPEDLVTRGLAYIPQTSNTFPNLTVRENLEMGAITRRPGWAVNVNPFLAPAHFVRGAARGAHQGGLRLVRWVRYRRRRTDATPPPAEVTRGRPKALFEQRVRAICEIFPNLRPKLGVRVSTLSGGEQQMVAIAKTLVLDPKCLLIDEPSAGLAPKLVSLVFEKIKEINEQGVAIVLVEQNARRALALADRGYVLEAGRNRYEAAGNALLTDPDVGRLYLGG